jgi:hypothetical protein
MPQCWNVPANDRHPHIIFIEENGIITVVDDGPTGRRFPTGKELLRLYAFRASLAKRN